MSNQGEGQSVSPNDAKPVVSRRVWVVYPDSVRMGLSDENRPAAWFVYSDHAHRFGKLMWEGFYKVRHEEIHGG
jgi:hypothetical protein